MPAPAWSVLACLCSIALGRAAPAHAASSVRLAAYSADGKPLGLRELLRYIAPAAGRDAKPAGAAGLYVTDLNGAPAAGRPWWMEVSGRPALSWSGPDRVKLSLPWPVAGDGFSTVFLDNGGTGYKDKDSVLLNEDIAETEHRLFLESLQERRTDWKPAYKPEKDFLRLQKAAAEAMRAAAVEADPKEKARLYDAALGRVAAAWEKMLVEHGAQIAAGREARTALRWGLTLDESLLDRLEDYGAVLKQLRRSGATWVRLVFRLNPDDFEYKYRRSFNEYDRVVGDLSAEGIHVMGSVLDSALWPRDMSAPEFIQRTRNIVLHYKDSIRSWEVASEVNGAWLGGYKHPLPDSVIIEAVAGAARQVKEIDPSLETVGTLYWWEGTAGDDVHPLSAWLSSPSHRAAFEGIDVAALSVYPDDNPMGLAFDPAFQMLARYFPDKKLMLGGFGYVEKDALEGYWWFDPGSVHEARKDLVDLYTRAACAAPRSLGGGFWWSALTQMLGPDRRSRDLLSVFKRASSRLRR